jgi:hypothetical protein
VIHSLRHEGQFSVCQSVFGPALNSAHHIPSRWIYGWLSRGFPFFVSTSLNLLLKSCSVHCEWHRVSSCCWYCSDRFKWSRVQIAVGRLLTMTQDFVIFLSTPRQIPRVYRIISLSAYHITSLSAYITSLSAYHIVTICVSSRHYQRIITSLSAYHHVTTSLSYHVTISIYHYQRIIPPSSYHNTLVP